MTTTRYALGVLLIAVLVGCGLFVGRGEKIRTDPGDTCQRTRAQLIAGRNTLERACAYNPGIPALDDACTAYEPARPVIAKALAGNKCEELESALVAVDDVLRGVAMVRRGVGALKELAK